MELDPGAAVNQFAGDFDDARPAAEPRGHRVRIRRGSPLKTGYSSFALIRAPLLYYSLMCQPIASTLITGLVFFSASVSATTYTTNFPNTENPIAEGGNWKNGAADGIDWTNCRTKPGLVFGTESGTGRNQYDDSTCILGGKWGPQQTVQATVFSQNQSDAYFQEVELRLHSTMSAHSSTGYEVLFRAYHPGGYATIVRWNGALGKFTYLNQKASSNYKGIRTGDVVKATIDGNGLIIGYVNGVEVIRATDTTYTGGNSGIGFWLEGRQGVGTNADYGFSTLTATDGVETGLKAGHYTAEEKGTTSVAFLGGASRRPSVFEGRKKLQRAARMVKTSGFPQGEALGLLIPFRNYGATAVPILLKRTVWQVVEEERREDGQGQRVTSMKCSRFINDSREVDCVCTLRNVLSVVQVGPTKFNRSGNPAASVAPRSTRSWRSAMRKNS